MNQHISQALGINNSTPNEVVKGGVWEVNTTNVQPVTTPPTPAPLPPAPVSQVPVQPTTTSTPTPPAPAPSRT